MIYIILHFISVFVNFPIPFFRSRDPISEHYWTGCRLKILLWNPFGCAATKYSWIDYLILQRWILIEKLAATHLIKKLILYESWHLLLYSQNPATDPCSQPNESNPNAATSFLKIYFNTVLPSMPRSSKWSPELTLLIN